MKVFSIRDEPVVFKTFIELTNAKIIYIHRNSISNHVEMNQQDWDERQEINKERLVNATNNFIQIEYDNLINNIEDEVKKICNFLNIEYKDCSDLISEEVKSRWQIQV
jgi:hypothetical protein